MYFHHPICYVSTVSARKAMERMVDLRHELGDIKLSLEELHKNPNNTDIGESPLWLIPVFTLVSNPAAHKIESLVKLEAKYGPLPQYSPSINDALEYLKKVCLGIFSAIFSAIIWACQTVFINENGDMSFCSLGSHKMKGSAYSTLAVPTTAVPIPLTLHSIFLVHLAELCKQ